MMILNMMLISGGLCLAATGAVRSGKASAEWLAGSEHYQPGKPFQTAFKLVVDDGWHTYWSNPGVSGMKLSVKWELPSGWSAGPVMEPVPIRFTTGGLAGFGYTGEVIFPVVLTPPAEGGGEPNFKAKLSWLTCNDSMCFPGNVELELATTPGLLKASKDLPAIEKTLATVPVPRNGLELQFVDEGKSIALTLTVSGNDFTPEDYEIFPATAQTIDAQNEIQFVKNDGKWTAKVPKGEYAPDRVTQLGLVFKGNSNQTPIIVNSSGSTP